MGGSPDIGADQATHARASVGRLRAGLAKTPLAATPSKPRAIQQPPVLFSFRVFLFRFAFGAIARRRAPSEGAPVGGRGDPGGTMDWAPTPTRRKPLLKISRTQIPEGSKDLIGAAKTRVRDRLHHSL